MATGSDEVTELGLRERKKLRTRETIVRVALELFSKQGFAETTIKQIADAAEVAPRTVSAYFPVKEQLVFHDHDQSLASLRAHLADRPAGMTAADAMRGWIAERMTEKTLDLDDARCRRALIESDPALRTYERGHMASVEQVVAEAVAVDLDLPADDLIPHMVGAATVAAFDALGRQLKTKAVQADDVFERARSLIDDAMAFVGGGVQALADRKRPAP